MDSDETRFTEEWFEDIVSQLVFYQNVSDSCAYLHKFYTTRIHEIMDRFVNPKKPRCFAIPPDRWYQSTSQLPSIGKTMYQYPLGTSDVIEVNIEGSSWYFPNTSEGRRDADCISTLHRKYLDVKTRSLSVSRAVSRLKFKSGLRKESKIKPRNKVFDRRKGWVPKQK